MPLKEFECPSCKHRFETVLWLSEPDPTACPKCGAAGLRHLLGTFRVIGASRKSTGLSPDEAAGGDMGSVDNAELDDLAGGASGFGEEAGGGGDFGGMEDAGGDEEVPPPETGGGGDDEFKGE